MFKQKPNTVQWGRANNGSYLLIVLSPEGEQVFNGTCKREHLAMLCMDLVDDYPNLQFMEDTGPLSLAEHIEATLG